MKNIVIFLVTCLAFVQSTTYAATSALTESLLEYEAIVSGIGTDPTFQGIISNNEFIVDMVRKTRRLDVTGTVKYFIETCTINNQNRCRKTRLYLATLSVQPNPGIGPNIVTLVDLQRVNFKGKNKNLKNREGLQKVEAVPEENGSPEHPALFQHITPIHQNITTNQEHPASAHNPEPIATIPAVTATDPFPDDLAAYLNDDDDDL
jgi:hypothetical protein